MARWYRKEHEQQKKGLKINSFSTKKFHLFAGEVKLYFLFRPTSLLHSINYINNDLDNVVS